MNNFFKKVLCSLLSIHVFFSNFHSMVFIILLKLGWDRPESSFKVRRRFYNNTLAHGLNYKINAPPPLNYIVTL